MITLTIETKANQVAEDVAVSYLRMYGLDYTQEGRTIRTRLDVAPPALLGKLSLLVEKGYINNLSITR